MLRRAALLLALCLLLGTARADATPLRWGVSPSAGGVLLDSDLDNYRWDVKPHAAWGIEAWAAQGPFELGLVLDRATTRQSTGIPGESFAPDVRMTTLALRGRYVAGSWWGLEPFTQVQAGRMHMGWSPDGAELDVLGGTTPVQVNYEPLDTWRLGVGVGIRHWLTSRLALGLQMEHTSFSLETLHRNGDTIEEQRERFGNWQWGVQMSIAPSGRGER